MGLNRQLANLPDAITTDTSNNVGIGGSPSGSYKLDVTGTAKVSSSVTSGFNGFNALGAYGFTSYEGAAASGKNIQFTLAIFNSIDGIYQSSGNTNDFGIWTNGGTSSQPKFYIKNAGNVGIGTSSPLSALDVRAASAIMGNYQTIQAFSTDSAAINLGGGISLGGYFTGTTSNAQFASIVGRKENGTSGNYDGYLAFGTNAQATGVVERMRITSAGAIQIKTAQPLSFFYSTQNTAISAISDTTLKISTLLSGTGNLAVESLSGTGSRAVLADANGLLSAPVSDITVKQNIKPIGYGLNEILKMNPVWFNFIDEYKNYGEGRQNGNIAQDMEAIIPEAVFTTPTTGKMGINYDQLHAVYIKAIQELKAEIDELKNK